MTTTRRELLAGAVGAVAAGLAGCATGTGDEQACEDGAGSSLAAEHAIPPADVREAVEPIRYEELSAAEKEVVAQAIRGDAYSECPPVSDAFASVLDRVAEHRAAQQDESGSDLTTVYLVRSRNYYALEATTGEETVSW